MTERDDTPRSEGASPAGPGPAPAPGPAPKRRNPFVALREAGGSLKRSVGRGLLRADAALAGAVGFRQVAMACCALGLACALALLSLPPSVGVGANRVERETAQRLGLVGATSLQEGWYQPLYLRQSQPQPATEPHMALCQLALWLDDAFTCDVWFDVRFLALVYLVLLVPAAYLLIRAATACQEGAVAQALAGLVTTAVVFDGFYLRTFASLYAAPFVYVGCAWVLALLLEAAGSSRRLPLCAGACGVALVLAFARPYLLPLPLAALAVSLALCKDAVPDRDHRLLLAGMVTGVLVGSIATALLAPSTFGTASKVHALTRGVLMQAEDPAATADELGIPRSYALLADQSLFSEVPEAAETDPALRDLASRYSYLDVAAWYGEHPDRALAMLGETCSDALDTSWGSLGAYQEGEGERGSSEVPLALVGRFRRDVLPTTLGTVGLVALALFAWNGLWRIPRRRRHPEFEQGLAGLWLLAAGMASLAAVVVCSGDAEVAWHQTLTAFSFDFALLAVAWNVIRYASGTLKKAVDGDA